MKYNIQVNIEVDLDMDRLEDEDFENVQEVFQSGAANLGNINCSATDENQNNVTDEFFGEENITEVIRNLILEVVNSIEEEAE